MVNPGIAQLLLLLLLLSNCHTHYFLFKSAMCMCMKKPPKMPCVSHNYNRLYRVLTQKCTKKSCTKKRVAEVHTLYSINIRK